MVKYPNDPGLDRHDHPGHYRPHEEMTLISTDVFLEGISLQTKYAYKCSEEFYNKSTKYADKIGSELTSRVNDLELDTQNTINGLKDAISTLDDHDVETDERVRNLSDGVRKIQSVLSNRLTGKDYHHMIDQIYSTC